MTEAPSACAGYRETTDHITVAQEHVGGEAGSRVTSVLLDGVEQHERMIPLVDDHRDHAVTVILHAG